MAKLIPVKYISIWDGDEIVTNARLNPETGEVVDIETVDISNEYNTCEGEYVEYPGGERFRVVENNGRYFVYPIFHRKLIDLINAILDDLREFKSEGYPIYKKQINKANTNDFKGLKRLLEIACRLIDDLEEFDSENILFYRRALEELGCNYVFV